MARGVLFSGLANALPYHGLGWSLHRREAGSVFYTLQLKLARAVHRKADIWCVEDREKTVARIHSTSATCTAAKPSQLLHRTRRAVEWVSARTLFHQAATRTLCQYYTVHKPALPTYDLYITLGSVHLLFLLAHYDNDMMTCKYNARCESLQSYYYIIFNLFITMIKTFHLRNKH